MTLTPNPFSDVVSDDDHRRILEQTFLQRLDIHQELPSTNDFAISLIKRNLGQPDLPTPSAVWALRQTSGRGRGENSWWSETGALTFSVIIEPTAFGIAPSQWPCVSLTAALAVCEAIEMCASLSSGGASSFRPEIKWPNDVYVENRKVCGILVEAPSTAGGCMVVGVGVNVGNSLHTAPIELRRSAVALVDVLPQRFNLASLLIAVCQRWSDHLPALARNDPQLAQNVQSRFFLTGKSLCLQTQTGRFSGRCIGISADGGLRLEIGGKENRFYSGSVIQFE